MSRLSRSLSVVLLIIAVSQTTSSTANGQSSTRPMQIPSVTPTAQPQYSVQPYQSQLPVQSQVPVQGSTTRGPIISNQVIEQAPMQGSATRGQVIESQPMNAQYGNQYGNVVQQAAAPAPTFDDKLWNYLLRSKYKNWAPVPGKSDAAYEGESPHGAYLKMYLNRLAAGNADSLPNGSIVIKENFTPAKELAAITVMYKTAGYNPKAGDWYWVKYNTDGTVASKSTPKGAMRLSGRVGGCIDCHGDAGGGDFAFFND